MPAARKTMATFTNSQYREDYQLTEGQAKKKVSFAAFRREQKRNDEISHGNTISHSRNLSHIHKRGEVLEQLRVTAPR